MKKLIGKQKAASRTKKAKKLSDKRFELKAKKLLANPPSKTTTDDEHFGYRIGNTEIWYGRIGSAK